MAEHMIPDYRYGNWHISIQPIPDKPAMAIPPATPAGRRAVWLARGILAVMLAMAGAAFVFGHQVPCEVWANLPRDTEQPPLAGTTGVTTGDVTAAVAADNRQYIESQAIAALPGPVQLDRALTVKSGSALVGGSIKNAFYSATFPLNCSAQCYGSGVGYAGSISRVSATKWRVEDPAELGHCQVGGVAHFFRYDGYFDATGQLCARRTISGISGNVLTLSSSIDARCNRIKTYDIAAPIIQDVRPGQISVSVPSTAHAAQFAAGDYVMVTAGADVANSDHCEFHRCVGVLNFTVQLESPTLRPYKSAVVAKYGAIHDTTIKSTTIEQPVNSGANGAFFKYLCNSRLDGVTARNFALSGCSGMTISNCDFSGEVGMNACHGITFINCRMSRLALEECCFDIQCVGCTFGPAEVPLQSSVGCERLTFRGCTVTGGNNMPVSIGGPDMTFDDFAIEATTRSLYAYFSGDRLKVSRLRCDPNCEPVLYGGNGICVQGVQARQTNLGWIDGSNSSGVALDCANVIVRQGVWRP